MLYLKLGTDTWWLLLLVYVQQGPADLIMKHQAHNVLERLGVNKVLQ